MLKEELTFLETSMRRSPEPGIHTRPAGLWVGLGWREAGVSAATDPCGQWPGGGDGAAVMSPGAHVTMPEDISGWQISGWALLAAGRWTPEMA